MGRIEECFSLWRKGNELVTTKSSLLTMKLTPQLLEQLHLHCWDYKSAGAFFGLCFGLLAPLVGSLLTGISWFTGPHWHGFFIQRDGTVLLFLTIPLLILGAHCLDLMEKKNEARRVDIRTSSQKFCQAK